MALIEFEKIALDQREKYRTYLKKASEHGCGYSFANMFLWGRQKVQVAGNRLVIFSHYAGATVYPFPAGDSDPKPAMDAVIQDAHDRGIPCRVTGLLEKDRKFLDETYPGKFRFHCGRDGYDYVYDINDLADLKGRKFQQKRNHVNKFRKLYSDYYVKPIDESILSACKNMVDNWYYRRNLENPHEDLQMEQVAFQRAFAHYRELELEGLALFAGGKMAALTIGSFLDDITIDVHFEKADSDIEGAYTVINQEFARYIREKYPQVQYFNREEDLGSAGLRKAKLSYNPHHMVEKCWAHLKVEEYDD